MVSCRRDDFLEPKIQDITQLSPVFIYEVIDGKRYISIEKSRCLSRKYRHNRDFIGPITETVSLHITRCDRSVGYDPIDYVKLHNYKDAVRTQINLNTEPSTVSR